MKQFDITCDHKGYFYCDDIKEFAACFDAVDLVIASNKKYKSTSTCVQLVKNEGEGRAIV